MGNRKIKATLIELLAVTSVVSPLVGYGLTELSGNGLYFILGACVFCAWMMLVPVLFYGTFKRRADDTTAEVTEDAPDTPNPTDA